MNAIKKRPECQEVSSEIGESEEEICDPVNEESQGDEDIEIEENKEKIEPDEEIAKKKEKENIPKKKVKAHNKAAEKKPPKPKIIVNVLNTEYDVVKEVMKKGFKYKLSMDPQGEFDLFWADTGVTPEMLTKLKDYQKINHYPGMSCLARKNNLGKNLMRMRKKFPKEFNFFPQTWLLPIEWPEFKNQFNTKKNKTFILKPEALSQGKGIFLTRTWENINQTEHYVAQRYLHKPYLIDGLKFDLRIYALVYGCDPLRIYIYKEGLARLATEPYVSPMAENLDNFYMHLTNYAINKNSENFIFNTDPEKADVGHKRSLSFIWRYVDEHGGNSEKLQKEITKCIVKTLCSVQSLLCHSYRSCQPQDNDNNKCFEILGFDILLDYKLKPWLLEVNHSPSFTTDTPYDHKVKYALLSDTVRMLKMKLDKRLKYYKKKQVDEKTRVLGKPKTISQKLSKEERAIIRQKKMEKRDRYEMENCGDWVRVYPDENSKVDYDKYIQASNEFYDEFVGGKKKMKEVKNEKDQQKAEKIKKPPLVPTPIAKRPSLIRAAPSSVPRKPGQILNVKNTKIFERKSGTAMSISKENSAGKLQCEDKIPTGELSKSTAGQSENFQMSSSAISQKGKKCVLSKMAGKCPESNAQYLSIVPKIVRFPPIIPGRLLCERTGKIFNIRFIRFSDNHGTVS